VHPPCARPWPAPPRCGSSACASSARGRAEEIRALAREDPGQVLADLAAFYRAFAYAPETEEPTDHVAVEAGFVGYLWLKEAYALAQVDTAAAGLTASARGRFIEVHVAAPAATSPAPDPGDEVECACVASELNGDGARDNSSPETANTPRS
jgi:hypothetical protein